MNKVQEKISLNDLFREVRALRRDVAVFMPMESSTDYKNKKEIASAYRDARRHIASLKIA